MMQRTLGRTGFQVSVLGLGTTEIGFVYGIGPRELPSDTEAIHLLQHIVDRGVTFIDTANYYGVAEERIAASGITKKPGVIVASKCGHVLDRSEPITDEELRSQFRAEVEDSLKKLKMESIPLVQVHGGTAEQIGSGLISHVMNEMKTEGKLQFFGISTRGEDAPLAAIKDGNFDTLQLAHSILDQRMVSRVFAEASKHEIGVINRSVLLKGALTPARAHLAPSLAQLKSHADKAELIAQDLGITLPQLAVRFAISNPVVSSALVGSSKIKNLDSAIDAAEEGPLPTDILQELYDLAIADPKQVDPKNWDTNYIADVK